MGNPTTVSLKKKILGLTSTTAHLAVHKWSYFKYQGQSVLVGQEDHTQNAVEAGNDSFQWYIDRATDRTLCSERNISTCIWFYIWFKLLLHFCGLFKNQTGCLEESTVLRVFLWWDESIKMPPALI